jgi:hypothetical protein
MLDVMAVSNGVEEPQKSKLQKAISKCLEEVDKHDFKRAEIAGKLFGIAKDVG